MRIRVVDGADQAPHYQRTLISYVINDHLAIDAGGLALLPLCEQRELRSICLSHSHADHIATLPLLIDNVYQPGPDCLTLYAGRHTLHELRKHVFNGRIWPDVFQLSRPESPFVHFLEALPGQTIELGDCRVTPFDVAHTLPTLGFVIEDQQVAVAIVGDTAPCDGMWEFLSGCRHLKAVFLEISYPNSWQWLADVAKHLTPNDFLKETRKLKRDVQWYVTHMKLEHAEAIVGEVAELGIPQCQFAMGGACYEF